MPEEVTETFETALARLQTLVERMENGDLPLEELIERYEEGTALTRFCEEKLDAAEKKIEIITHNATGEMQLAPFDPAHPVAEIAEPEPTRKPAKTAKNPPKTDPGEVSLF